MYEYISEIDKTVAKIEALKIKCEGFAGYSSNFEDYTPSASSKKIKLDKEDYEEEQKEDIIYIDHKDLK